MFQRTTKLLRGLSGFADDKWVSALIIEGIRSSAYRQVLARFGFGFGADLLMGGQLLKAYQDGTEGWDGVETDNSTLTKQDTLECGVLWFCCN